MNDQNQVKHQVPKVFLPLENTDVKPLLVIRSVMIITLMLLSGASFQFRSMKLIWLQFFGNSLNVFSALKASYLML